MPVVTLATTVTSCLREKDSPTYHPAQVQWVKLACRHRGRPRSTQAQQALSGRPGEHKHRLAQDEASYLSALVDGEAFELVQEAMEGIQDLEAL